MPRAQPWVEHRQRIAVRAHLAGAYRVVLRVGTRANVGGESGRVVASHWVETLFGRKTPAVVLGGLGQHILNRSWR